MFSDIANFALTVYPALLILVAAQILFNRMAGRTGQLAALAGNIASVSGILALTYVCQILADDFVAYFLKVVLASAPEFTAWLMPLTVAVHLPAPLPRLPMAWPVELLTACWSLRTARHAWTEVALLGWDRFDPRDYGHLGHMTMTTPAGDSNVAGSAK